MIKYKLSEEYQLLNGWEGEAEDQSAGGVVYRTYQREGNTRYLVALIRRANNWGWDLPKGHPEAYETLEEAAIREVYEETGLHAEVMAELGEARYMNMAKRGLVRKAVRYYVMRDLSTPMEAAPIEPTAQPGETQDAAWCDLDGAFVLVHFDNTRAILALARHWLHQNQPK